MIRESQGNMDGTNSSNLKAMSRTVIAELRLRFNKPNPDMNMAT